eukprot:CAMPEP_0201568694 /NCGR_PEP_ID=MMETSP0190_2-20130828/9911_1 /ASSEMBLY_ACC=CAM_ASM_000263 /TAXON_ID=37353 /ORGANISM="Rosalina sp." /LENGTH=175 /DNA_ID=CAMNT_0047990097 /DNA_START=36 /DNA_END=563 /DNA_ORIENTATION=+
MALPVKKTKKKAMPPQMQRGFSKKNIPNGGRNVPKGKSKGKQPVKGKGKAANRGPKGGKGKAPKKGAKGGKALTSKAAAPPGMKRTTTKKDLSYKQMAGGGGKRKSAYYGPGTGGGRISGFGKAGLHGASPSKTRALMNSKQSSRTVIMLNSNEKRGSVLHLFNSGKNKKKKSKK